MRAIWTGIAAFVTGFTALQIAYPWDVYYGHFKFGWWYTMASYLLLAGVLGVIAGGVAGMLPAKPSVTRVARGAAGGVTMFALACLLALVFGLAGLNIPGTRVRGIFFAEWKFIPFIVCVACPVSAMGALLCALRAPEPDVHHRSNPS